MSLTSAQPKIKAGILLFVLISGFGVAGYFGKDVVLRYFAKASSCPVKDLKITQVGSRSAELTWTTDDAVQGRIEYGTNPTSMAQSLPEIAAVQSHKVSLGSLAEDQNYHFVVAVGVPGKVAGTTDTIRCDALGEVCKDDVCSPWNFKTSRGKGRGGEEASGSAVKVTRAPEPTSSMSNFCQSIRKYIGKTNKDASWSASFKQYDIDSNNVINGLDVIKCPKTGK